jgi:uncharacterized protein
MRKRTYFLTMFTTVLVVLISLTVAIYFIFIDFFVNFWWFQSLHFETYFWLRLFYKFIFSGGVTLVFFTLFFFHFWIASRYLGLNPESESLYVFDKRQKYKRLADNFARILVKIYTPISLVLAIFIAFPFYQKWETSLLYFFGRSSGVNDSVYGNDISFYLLSYPLYILIQKELLTASILILSLVGILYWLEHAFIPGQKKEYPLGAKIHLTALLGMVVAFVIWGFILKRFSLLYTETNEPIFYGPGLIELRYQLPLIWLAIFSFLALSVSAELFIFSEKPRIKTPLLISGVAFLFFLWLPTNRVMPDIIQKYIINPNPVKTNKPFIKNNIEATLNAYDLNNVNIIDLPIKLDPSEDVSNWTTQKRIENIPVWDREFLIDSYRQLQEIRPYYTFNSIDEDRYFILDHVRQVNFAAREVNLSKLPPEAQNWENIHLRYTHGYGAVVTPAAQDADKPLAWYLRDLNLYSPVGLSVKNPDIYYGEEQYSYAVVPNQLSVVAISGDDVSIQKPFTGEAGIPFNSLFRKVLLAVYLHDLKIFFSPNITDQSKLKIHRNIKDRIRTLTPFLYLDTDPYLVITKDRFYWIQDAYTVSNWYPVSKATESDILAKGEKLNYIRNSVKIVVDAYDGQVDYYISDPSDPLIEAYANSYPGLFKHIEEMPADLYKHLRYPRDFYYLQMKIYAKYHQQDPALFYQQSETWQFAKVRGNLVMPYYQTMDFGHCDNIEEFVLINPMTPINRNNLSIIGLAGVLDKKNCTLNYHPGITIYNLGKKIQVNGPAQVEALIHQDPDISQEFTLWDMRGSRVQLGRMIILPMGNTILYVQPVYLVSTVLKIPELTRVIVSIGNHVVMDKTLWSAFSRLKKIFTTASADLGGTETSKAVVNDVEK